MVEAVRLQDVERLNELFEYRLEIKAPSHIPLDIESAFDISTLRQECKIYQDKCVIETIDDRLIPYVFTVENRLKSEPYPKRAYQVQHNESDFEFFARSC